MEAKFMTVINEEHQLECINLSEVDFIEVEKRRIVYHIGDRKFFHLSTKTEFDELLIHEGFLSLDRPNLVNLKKIRSFNENYGIVYFEEKPTTKSKSCTVAKIKESLVKNLLKRLVAYHTDGNLEIKHEFKNIQHILKGIFN